MQLATKNWVAPELIEKARQVDIITYLNRYEPGELVQIRGDVYTIRSHDSIKISIKTGKWMRWATGDGGHTAIDYLVKVQGMTLQDAVRLLTADANTPPQKQQDAAPVEPKEFVLPEPNTDEARVIAYLIARGIDPQLIGYCISKGYLYEDAQRHNCVFVGVDSGGIARNAMLRSSNSNSTFLREWDSSDKRCTFSILTNRSARTVCLFESCIDLLSYITLATMRKEEWHGINYVSLNGIYFSQNDQQSKPPQALEQYLQDYPCTKELHICVDNDFAGHKCLKLLQTLYAKEYAVVPDLPKEKDYNAQIMLEKGILQQVKTRGENMCER